VVRPVKKSTISIPAAAFGVKDSHITSASRSQSFYAPVYLPHGAKITKIGFIGWKQSWSKGDTTLKLRCIDSWVTQNNHVIKEVGVVSTAAPPTAMQDYYSVQVNNYLVNNTRQAYFLILNLPADAPGYPGANNFYSADIEYKVP
jgi:hypothetical protein